MYYLYWIHTENQTNPLTEGYIGISKEPEKRFKAHISNTSPVGSKTIRDMEQSFKDSLKHSILLSLNTLQEAREEELKYRPHKNIGWNVCKGGGITPDCSGRKHDEQTKKDISSKNRLTKSKRNYTSIFKGMTNRHSDEQKKKIGSYHKGKTISAEHKKAITEKNSGINNSKSKSVTILDTFTGVKAVYVNLKEASESLNINYSTVRCAVQRKSKLIYKRYEIVEVVE